MFSLQPFVGEELCNVCAFKCRAVPATQEVVDRRGRLFGRYCERHAQMGLQIRNEKATFLETMGLSYDPPSDPTKLRAWAEAWAMLDFGKTLDELGE